MIRDRLTYVRFDLRILMLLLYGFGCLLAVQFCFGFGCLISQTPAPDMPSYSGVLLFAAILWAVSSECAGLKNKQQLLGLGTKYRRFSRLLLGNEDVRRDSIRDSGVRAGSMQRSYASDEALAMARETLRCQPALGQYSNLPGINSHSHGGAA